MSPFDQPTFPNQPSAQTFLEPLLDDFQYWFDEANTLLTSNRAACLAQERRQDLLEQVSTAQQEVATARTLMLATSGQAGVEIAKVGSWHQIVAQCWQAARQIRQANA